MSTPSRKYACIRTQLEWMHRCSNAKIYMGRSTSRRMVVLRGQESKKFSIGALVLALAVALAVALPSAAMAAWTGGHDVVGCGAAGRTWYFAEGTTRPGFEEWLCIANPNAEPATANLTYMLSTGENIAKSYQLAPSSRSTVDVRSDVPAGSDVSVSIAATLPVVAERPMYFRYNGTVTGGHDVVGASAPRRAWYFAEGTCRPGFDSYLCMQNPASQKAHVTITYMLGDGTTRTRAEDVGANSRLTVCAAETLGTGDDAAHDFSCSIETDSAAGIVAERPMYFNYKGAWTGGHDVMGAAAPGLDFYFAEGTCRPGFDPYLCIQNPGAEDARIQVTYMLGDGNRKEKLLDVPKHSRKTIEVMSDLGRGDDPAHDFSCRVQSLNGQPIVAERPMYFNYKGVWTGGHDVVGATTPASSFFFAEGTCRPGFDPYICIQNPGAEGADVTITYLLGDGNNRQQVVALAPGSRSTVYVKNTLGEANDTAHDFSCRVEAAGGAGIVCERPMYFSYRSGAKWTLAAVGDVNLGGDVLPYLQSNGFDWPWKAVGEMLRDNTLTFANLECAISDRGTAVPGKSFTFRGPPDGLPPMRDAGVDVVSQANNHSRDFGADALLDSLAHLDKYGISHCGAGADYGSAHAPAYLMANGLRVAFLAYDDIGYAGWPAGAGYPGDCNAKDTARMVADIQSAKQEADVVVVSFHWGTEKKYTPDPSQVNYAHLAVDSGADLVLGHHPHVAQGFEIYRGKLVAYSLGNFVFSPGSPECRYTILTRLQMDSSGFNSARVYPAYISNGQPALMSGADGDGWISQVASMSHALGTPVTVTGGHATIP